MSLSQLAEATSLTVPNVQRITHTLVELGLLTKDESRKKYALTPRALDIGYRYLNSGDISKVINPQTGMTIKQTNASQQLLVGIRYVLQ